MRALKGALCASKKSPSFLPSKTLIPYPNHEGNAPMLTALTATQVRQIADARGMSGDGDVNYLANKAPLSDYLRTRLIRLGLA
ncbi:MAG TPA: hypothetical protein VMU06_12895 [Stellaceae bacterium]|nr:hypothetical protein [Stellaceae bacterium]